MDCKEQCFCCPPKTTQNSGQKTKSSSKELSSVKKLSVLASSLTNSLTKQHNVDPNNCLCCQKDSNKNPSSLTNSNVAAPNLKCDFYILHMNSSYLTNYVNTACSDNIQQRKPVKLGLIQSSLSDSSCSSSKENDDLSSELEEDMELGDAPSKWMSVSRANRGIHRVRKPYDSKWKKLRTLERKAFSCEDESSRDSAGSFNNRSNPGTPERIKEGLTRSKSLDNLPFSVEEEEDGSNLFRPYHFELESMNQKMEDLQVT